MVQTWKPGDFARVTAPDIDHRCEPGSGDAVLHDDTAHQWVCANYQSGGEGKIEKISHSFDKYMSKDEVDIQLGHVRPFNADTQYAVEDAAGVKTIENSWQAGDTILTLRGDSSHHCSDPASEVLLDSRTNEWVCSFLQQR